MIRIASVLFALVWALPATAHVGHIGEAAGHGHWIGGIAIGLAIGLTIWGLRKGKKAAEEAEVEETAEEEAGEGEGQPA